MYNNVKWDRKKMSSYMSALKLFSSIFISYLGVSVGLLCSRACVGIYSQGACMASLLSSSQAVILSLVSSPLSISNPSSRLKGLQIPHRDIESALELMLVRPLSDAPNCP